MKAPPKLPTSYLATNTLPVFDSSVVGLLGYALSLKYMALPIAKEGNHLTVAMAQPTNTAIISHLTDLTGMYIVPVSFGYEKLRLEINQRLGTKEISRVESQFLVDAIIDQNASLQSPEILEAISATPAVRLVDSLLEFGILNQASDIHIEPFEDFLQIRTRIDGQLQPYKTVDIALVANVLSRLKIMGGLNIAEKRIPQDGHFTLHLNGEKIEFRLSTLPTIFGEKAVIRLLYGQGRYLAKTELGFFDEDLARLNTMFNIPHGAIFITGPTGSGKTTTLTSFMAGLTTMAKNIVTIEDPVENPLPGVNHVNVAPGLPFAAALRHILRQDPDVIMVGEVRDEETARMAIQAATTGHVVLCTIHTNDLAGVIERLIDMGIEPYLSGAALGGIISQRLVRRICPQCKTAIPAPDFIAQKFNLPQDATIYTGKGCNHCGQTGYKGRIAIYEYLLIETEEQRRALSQEPYQYATLLRAQSIFKQNATKHLLEGNAAAEEILKLF